MRNRRRLQQRETPVPGVQSGDRGVRHRHGDDPVVVHCRANRDVVETDDQVMIRRARRQGLIAPTNYASAPGASPQVAIFALVIGSGLWFLGPSEVGNSVHDA